jgi:hypothetical protein
MRKFARICGAAVPEYENLLRAVLDDETRTRCSMIRFRAALEHARQLERASLRLPPGTAHQQTYRDARAAARDARDAWGAAYGLHRSTGRLCLSRLLGKRPSVDGSLAPGGSRYWDHVDVWTRGRSAVAVTSQVYGWSTDLLPGLEAWCASRGLAVRVEPEASWHSTTTTLLVYTRAGAPLEPLPQAPIEGPLVYAPEPRWHPAIRGEA